MPEPASNRRPADTALRGWLGLLWRQALWSLPFTFFFGTVYGASREAYSQSFAASLVFSYSIGHALWFTRYFIEPRCCPPGEVYGPGRWMMGMWYVGMAIVGSYAGAAIIHFFVMPGFLGSWRAWATSGLYTLVFVALFSGINFARVFYRQAVDRARAVEQARAELAQAELRALRARIHPHFLFNALNSIASLIATRPADAEETTTRLADAFRYTLRASERERVPLGDELDFVRAVLAIERVRFGDRLRVVEEIEPGLESVEVPSLLLQPLVENAVRHAVADRTEGGTLHLGAHRHGDRLVLTVADDGPGIRENAPSRGEGFGLRSVRERLHLAGPPHALDIESAPGAGTRIRITLPIPPSGNALARSTGGSA